MCALLVSSLPLKSDAVESQKVNDLLVRMAEVRRIAGAHRLCCLRDNLTVRWLLHLAWALTHTAAYGCALCLSAPQAQDPLLVGSSSHVPKLVQSFVEVLGRGTSLVDEPLGRRIAGLLHSMRPSLPGDLVEGAFAALNDKQKAAFSAYMAGSPIPTV
jgi:hypothetical protein